jgi:uncharacterized membrane protein
LGARSDLLGALRALQAAEGSAARKLSGVVLISDGADNAELAAGLSGPAKATVAGWGIPISTVVVGKGTLKDLSIDNVRVDDFAFVRNSLTAEVELHARGFKGQTVPVVLRREGHTIASKPVTFTDADDVRTVSFTFTPDQTGRFVYTVAVPVFPDETVAENNTRSFALKVIRDRVRVLLVAGRPSWDERFLRGLLKQDANVELISFYILRNGLDELGAPEYELSLIPFPKREIFQEKIDTFDLIVMVNFGNEERESGLGEHQADIRRYVLNGGALAFIGGDHSFQPSSQPDPFAEVLPVEIAGALDSASFRARATAEAQRHPITAIGTGAAAGVAVWEALPELPGLNLTRARAGATVLLEHPFVVVDGRNAPVLAVWEKGRGRVLALTTDGSWHWAFRAHATGAPGRTWERFWGNAIRWLVRDPDLTTMSVTPDAAALEPGKVVGAGVVVRLPDYQPAVGASVTVELVSADDGRTVGTRQGTTGEDGTLHVEFPPPPAGAYKLVGKASGAAGSLGESTDAVAVRAVGPELADARVNAQLLSDLAQASGGRFFEAAALSFDDVPLRAPPLAEVGRSRDQPLWDRWYWLALMVVVMGLEWGFRRRFGYI